MSGNPVHCVALVSDAFGGAGGIAQYNRDLLTAMRASSHVHEIHVLPRRVVEPEGVPAGIRQLPAKGRGRYVVSALATALSRRADVVFCGHVHFAALAAAIARIARARLIVQAHGIESWGAPAPACRAAVQASDLLLCVSRYTRHAVLRHFAVAPERAIVLSNTVGDAFTPGSADEFRNEHGLGKQKILLTVGRLDSRERYKGHDRVIATLGDLLADGHDLIYLIVGEGDDRARLEQVARNARGGDRVRFLGNLSAQKLIDAYRAADLFVMPSTGEGFGIAFIEAMACGTPALGLSQRGAADALADGRLGIMVSEQDLHAAIAESLRRPKPDAQALSADVRVRFGRSVFQERVNVILDRLCEFRPGHQFTI